MLQLLKGMLLEGNTLPNRNYEAKKILCRMGMDYKMIHTCPNACILYKRILNCWKIVWGVGCHIISWNKKMMILLKRWKIMDLKWRLRGIFPSVQGWSVCLQTQMMLRILDEMQMRGNVMACTTIQLILFNGRNLMMSFLSLVKSHEIFDLFSYKRNEFVW